MGSIKNFFKNSLSILLNHKKIFAVATILVLTLLYFLLPKGNTKVLSQKAQKINLVKTVSATGDVYSQNTANLSFATYETLAWVGVREGDSVIKGQAIASLDQNKLQATYRQALQDFTAAKAASDQYYDSNHNDTESYDQKVKRTALDATQNKAYDAMVKAQYDIAHSTLYSPINGIVTRLDAQNAGVNVTPSTTFTITDPSSLEFKMEVDESDIGKVETGQGITVSFDPFPDEIVKLSVDRIDFVSHKTSSGGNAFYVYAYLNDPGKYRVGMSGNADITVDSVSDAIAIPSSSVFDDNYAYVEKKGKYEKRKIEKGLENDIDIQVISGIQEGESVVLDPSTVPQNLIVK